MILGRTAEKRGSVPGLKAHVSCFWHGKAGAHAPKITAFAIDAFRRLPAEIETDFDTD
jgi:hypothetical protein